MTSATPTSGLTYADLIQIVELLRQSEQFSSFRLKTPELELEVLREGAQATERELREFVQSRLADFKVPRRILLLEEIPKGATGKLQRIGLAAKLGLG